MRSLGKKVRGAIALSLTFNILISPSFAADCGFLPNSTGSSPALNDRDLYYHMPSMPNWAKMDGTAPDFRDQYINFAYVIVENFADSRSGVMIVKSGRLRQLDEPQVEQSVKRVRLVRQPDGFNNGVCGAAAFFGKRSVSAKSYDEYHDQGRKVPDPDQSTLDAFHFKYAARHGCRLTNDATPDSYALLDFRSNLGQFSFNPDVVGDRTYSQLIALIKPSSAYASSDTLRNQRVEMKQYQSTPGKPVCVTFNLAVNGPANFLKINDLEGLTQSGVRYVRSEEQSWTLSH